MNFKLKPGATGTGMSKIFLAMKLIIAFILIALTQAQASIYGQTVSIKKKNVAVEEILLNIEKQTSYHFIYDSELDFLKTKIVSISENGSSITEVLDKCLEGLPVSYKIVQQTIALKSDPSKVSYTAAQEVTVSGTVVDEKGAPLPGVSVLVKGSTKGVATDKNGKFTLSVPDAQSTLVFSFISYLTQEVPLAGSTTINVTMRPADNKLSEVVVVGYGTQSKAKVSGAITTVKAKDVALSPSPNLASGLAGRVPGVTINNRGGEPGNDNVSVFIRGRSTTGDASPLYVIDGIPRDYNALNFIPPVDVESITVLKDASAAVYGSRAANGVILVTTKRGKTGKAVPPVTEIGTALFDRIVHERQVELAFEIHRYYDVRRWKIAPQTEPKPLQGFIITNKGNNNFDYNRVNVFTRVWDDKLYYLPISLQEVRSSGGSLQQSPGY